MSRRFVASGAALAAIAALLLALPSAASATAPKQVDPKYNVG
jgi:hypothetical protein